MIYIPKHFQMEQSAALEVIENNGFALLVSMGKGKCVLLIFHCRLIEKKKHCTAISPSRTTSGKRRRESR